jgi:zinc protease
MPKLKTVMDAELRKLLEQGVTDQELKRAQDSWLEQRQVSRSQDAALAGLLAEHLYAGRSIRYEADLEEKVRALTPDQVLAAAKKYLNLGNLVVVTAGDFQRQSQGAGAAGN